MSTDVQNDVHKCWAWLNIPMDSELDRFVRFYFRTRSKIRRRRRMIFPSPLELEFIEMMGGKVVRFTKLRDPRTNFPAAWIVSLGPMMKSQNVRREVRYGKYFVDFANDLDRIIEIDGAAYHMDVVADMDREIYIKAMRPGMRMMRIKTYEIRNNKRGVQQRVVKFLDLELPSKNGVHPLKKLGMFRTMYKKVVR